jgi:hypothetical protein
MYSNRLDLLSDAYAQIVWRKLAQTICTNWSYRKLKASQTNEQEILLKLRAELRVLIASESTVTDVIVASQLLEVA